MSNKQIVYGKKFIKSYQKIIKSNFSIEKRLKEKVALFLENQHSAVLRNHKLKGKLRDFRAFSITGDIRVIYREEKDYYKFIDIGTHSQVY